MVLLLVVRLKKAMLAKFGVDKIYNIIDDCRYGIHDISRTELDVNSGLPRLICLWNWGIFLGAKRFGVEEHQKKKKCLVMDRELYRHQKFISDIAGQDVPSHNNSPEEVVKVVRDWILTESERRTFPVEALFGAAIRIF